MKVFNRLGSMLYIFYPLLEQLNVTRLILEKKFEKGKIQSKYQFLVVS